MTYDEIKAINFSSLKHIARSPLLYQHRQTHPATQKQDFVIGGAIHTMVLEPEKFDSRYAIFDGTRRGKEWEAWQYQNPDKESLKPPEMAAVTEAAKAIAKHRIAGPLFTGGRCEEAVTWTNAETGLACKGRLDYITPRRLVDLKSARNIDPRNFARDAAKYLYHAQVAWYLDGGIAAGKLPTDAELPYVVAVEKTGPYDVAAYQLTEIDLGYGRNVYRALLRKLVECTAADYWPGLAPDLLPLNVPDWSNEPLTTDEEF